MVTGGWCDWQPVPHSDLCGDATHGAGQFPTRAVAGAICGGQ